MPVPLSAPLPHSPPIITAATTGDQFWIALGYTGLILNLFNMIPISPLDGGRITQVLSPRIWLLGAPLLGVLFFYQPSPLLIIILLMALPALRRAWSYDAEDPANIAYRDVPDKVRYEYMAMYFGLTGFLAIMAYNAHVLLLSR